MAGDVRSESLNRKLAEDVRDSGGVAAVIATDAMGPWKLPDVSEAVRTIVEILPIQMLSLALAARNGDEAGAIHVGSLLLCIGQHVAIAGESNASVLAASWDAGTEAS